MIRRNAGNTNAIQNFWDTYKQNKTHIESLRAAKQNGDFTRLQTFLNDPEFREKLVNLDKFAQSMGNISAMIHKLHQDPSMPPDEKRQGMEQLYNQMDEVATGANKMMEGLRAK